MCLQSNIVRRGAVYYARVGYPAELIRARAAAGLPKRLETLKSLRTKDPKEARRIGASVVAHMQAEFERELNALQQGDVPAKDVTRKLRKPAQIEIEAVAWEMLQADLLDDQRDRLKDPDEERRTELKARGREKAAAAAHGVTDTKRARLVALIAAIDEIGELERAETRKEKRRMERDAIASGSATDHYSHLADAIIFDRGWDVLPHSPDYIHLCNVLKSSRLHSLKAMGARDEGDFLSATANPQPPAHMTSAKVIAIKERAKAGESLLELLPQYLKEEGPGLSSEEIAKKRKVIRLFAEFVGLKKNVATITGTDIRDFKLKLRHWPRVANNQAAFKGKDFNQIVKKNAQLSRRTIGPATVNNYLSSLGAFFKWLYSNSYTSEVGLTEGSLIKYDKAAVARKSYSTRELKAIFSLPVFTGCEAQDQIARSGDHRISDWRFWIPVICLFSGARLGEVAQLRTSDVKKVKGHWVFHITDEGEGMEVKTPGSVRIVPIHPELQRLGLMNYHRRMTEQEHARLFPELTANEHGRRAAHVTEWLRGYVSRFELTGVNCYRFRHTFTDALRTAGHVNADIGPVLGHKEGSTTERYGQLPQVTIDRRAEIVASAEFEIELTPPKTPRHVADELPDDGKLRHTSLKAPHPDKTPDDLA